MAPVHPMVSVIVPTYNRLGRLGAAIRSVFAQSFGDFELIVVDDGSDDGTPEFVREGFRDGRLRFVRQVRGGVSRARNRGIALSRGDYVAFLDSDDEWTQSKLALQLRRIESDRDVGGVHTDEMWIRNGERVNQGKVHEKRGGWIYPHCLPMCRISPSAILLRRSALARIGWFDERYPVCEDYELWLRLTSRYPVAFLSQPLVIKHGGHQDQLSRSRWGLDRYRVRALLKNYRSLPESLRADTRCEIARKCRILATGYSNRGKERGARYFAGLAQTWSGSPDNS